MTTDDSPDPADQPSAEISGDHHPSAGDAPPQDDQQRASTYGRWGDAVAAFLDDLLDRRKRDDASVDQDDAGPSATARGPGIGQRVPSWPVPGPPSRPGVPAELADLPLAAARALARVTRPAGATDVVYPSIARALHDVVIAEVLADRLSERIGSTADTDAVAALVATTIDYFYDLAATRYEGFPVTHGAVIAADSRGLVPLSPPVGYPGRLPTRKRTPLLFDGTDAVLVIAPNGEVLGGFDQDTLPPEPTAIKRMERFMELGGVDGSLTAAASATFRGIGFYLRSDRTLWVFENGTALFIRRTGRWKSIALQSFVESLSAWGLAGEPVAERLARAAMRLSIQGRGAVLAIADDLDSLRGQLQPNGRPGDSPLGSTAVDDELSRLLPSDSPVSSSLMARLARIDGATIIDPNGYLLAYGAIVRSSPSAGQGARTAAARSLSTCANVVVSVSQDGPLSVFVAGEPVLDIL